MSVHDKRTERSSRISDDENEEDDDDDQTTSREIDAIIIIIIIIIIILLRIAAVYTLSILHNKRECCSRPMLIMLCMLSCTQHVDI